VAPIASYTASSSPYLSVMGYGSTDNQVTHSNGGISMLSNGNVGIGTTNPITALTITNNTTRNISPTISMYGYSDVAGFGPGINFYAFNNAITPQGRIEVFDAGNYGGNMIFSLKANAGTGSGPLVEYMRIAANGKVGIGITNPAYTLDVNGSINATGTIFSSTNATAFWMPSNGGSSFFITDSQSSPGNGTTTYGRYFGVSGVIYQDFYNLCLWRGCSVTGTVTTTTAMSLSSNGNLYVNGYVQTNGNQTNGGIYFTGDIAAAQWQICLIGSQQLGFNINTTGTIGPGAYTNRAYINSAGSYVPISDMRLKNTIEPIASGLSSILQLKPSTFFYNNNKTQLHAGFIAQDVLPILPLAVEKNKISEDNDTDYYYLNQTMIIPYLVKGMQEQHVIIQQQASEINELKSQLAVITQRLATANIA
jgi:hypothetical protein